MADELQLISDGDGLAVIGDPMAVEAFLRSEGLELASTALPMPKVSTTLSTGSGAAQAGSAVAAVSGRWVKLTKESAQLAQKHGLRQASSNNLSTGVIKGSGGQIKGFVEFAKGPTAMATNPALLAGAAGIMAQLAMQQAMDEITDYLATIDAKVDDVLRAQKDAVLADMIGVGLVLDEAMTIRKQVGRVSEVTWSKVQGTSTTIARTQAYALRQLEALTEKMEGETSVGDLADAARKAEQNVLEWLAVLARCFQLQDAVAVLELDRVLDAAPDELERHRVALRTARQNRLSLISGKTGQMLTRMNEATDTANAKVLLHPAASRAVVRSSNQVGTAVVDFHGGLGIEHEGQSWEARRWVDAATDVRDRVLETGAGGVDAARGLGSETLGRARSVTDKLSSRLVRRGRQSKDVEVAE